MHPIRVRITSSCYALRVRGARDEVRLVCVRREGVGWYEPSWQNGAEPPGLPGFDSDPGAPELPAPLSPPPRDVAEGVLAWIDGVRRAAGI